MLARGSGVFACLSWLASLSRSLTFLLFQATMHPSFFTRCRKMASSKRCACHVSPVFGSSYFLKSSETLFMYYTTKSRTPHVSYLFHVPTSDSVCVRAYLHQLPRSYVSIRTRVCIRVTIRHESSSKSKRGVRHHAPRHRHHAKRMCVFRYVRRNRWRGVMRVRSSIIMVRLPLVTLSTRRGEVLESGPGWNQ